MDQETQLIIDFLDNSKGKNVYAVGSAIKELGLNKHKPSLPLLLRLLQHENSQIRFAAASALGHLGEPQALEPLIQTLQDHDEDVRMATVLGLRNLGDITATEALIACLNDETGYVREVAVEALGDLKSYQAIPYILEALKDEDEEVRAMAANVLGNLGAKGAGDDLVRLAYDEEEETKVRSSAIYSIPQLVPDRSFDLLKTLYDKSDDDPSRIRATIIGAMAALRGDKRALEFLLAILDGEDEWISLQALYALGSLGDKAAFEALMDNDQKRKDRATTQSTLVALGMLKNRRAHDFVDSYLLSSYADEKARAAFAAGELGDQQFLPKLYEALNDQREVDDYGTVSKQAKKAIEQILATKNQ